MHRSKVKTAGLFFFYLLIILNPALAQGLDKAQALHLSADDLFFNWTKKKGSYQGHVKIDQGFTHLQANQAFTTFDKYNKLIEARAKGTTRLQAHVWTQTALKKPPVHAYADEIWYYPARQLIELIGHASVHQEGNTFKAPLIRYDLKTQRVLTEAKGDSRTHIVIKNGKLP